MNVLVLETNAAQAATIRRVVIGLCARLTVVQSIEAALPLLRDNAPDVVLLPALVSPVDEKQLLETLRALPHGGDIEILITPVLSIPVEHCAGSPSQRWPWKAARRRVAEPPSDEELRHFEERLRWSFARARARRERSDSRLFASFEAGFPA